MTPGLPPATEGTKFIADIIVIVVAMLGGAAKYFDRYLKEDISPKLGHLAAQLVISAFSGYMSYQAVMKFIPEWSLFASGIGGYLGIQGIEWLSEVLKARISSTTPMPNGQTNNTSQEESKPKAGEG